MSNRKTTIIISILGLIKENKSFGGGIIVKVDLSNYAPKADLEKKISYADKKKSWYQWAC